MATTSDLSVRVPLRHTDPVSWLEDYGFAQEGLFLLPAERLTSEGLDPGYAALVRERAGVDEGWTDLFDAAIRTYFARTTELARATPQYWFPPRVQTIGVVTEPARVRPYFQPFHRSSWLLHAGDFDPAESDLEFAVFQLVQAERMGIVRDVVTAFACNLSWWLARTDEECAAFRAAAARSTRPDAGGYRELADALPWLREVHHEVLRPARLAAPGTVTVPGTGLVVPGKHRPRMDALLRAWTETVRSVAAKHYAGHADTSGDPGVALCAWLAERAPRVVITGAGNELLWDPAEPGELARVREELAPITRSAAESLRADLEVVDERTSAFLDALAEPAALPAPDPRTADQNGPCYMHLERREVAYNLAEPGMQRLREPAPPYERFMLAARAVHEWGHLAAGGGWIRVPEEREGEYEERLAEIGRLYDGVLAAAPRSVARRCAPSLATLARGHASAGAALARLGLQRIEDFQSNLMSQRFLTPEERETYIRNNVRSLVHDFPPEAMFERLARYVYEYQYLRFSGMADPRGFFLATTWIREQYLNPGILSERALDELLEAMARLCDLYEIDEARFA